MMRSPVGGGPNGPIPTSNSFSVLGEQTGEGGKDPNPLEADPALKSNGFRTVTGRKRTRPNDTPEKTSSVRRYIDRINQDTIWAKTKLGEAALTLKAGRIADLAGSVQMIINGTLVDILERQASTLSDMVGEMVDLDQARMALSEENNALRDEIAGLKVVKEKQEVRNACKEAEAKLALASKQCKIPDVNVGSCITDRKQLVDTAKAKVRESIREDLKAKYDAKIARASVAVVARASQKRAFPNGEAWVAPLLLTLQNKDDKWEVEDLMRKSNIHPTFHWPKELIEPVKTLRKVVNDMGYSQDRFYIRIRPEEREGTWKIRADVKAKEGSGRFVPAARWAVPPLDENIRATVKDWEKPVWSASNGQPKRVNIQANGEGEARMIDSTADTMETVMDL